MSGFVPLVVVVILGIGYLLVMRRGAIARRALMTRTARTLGLRYSPTDPFGLQARFPLPLFGHPTAILTTHEPRDLMFGTADDLPICVFDMTLDLDQLMRVQASGPENPSEPEDRWADFESSMREDDAVTLMCCLFPVDLDAPTLRVEPTPSPGLPRAVNPSDIRFESGSFNERFSVHCDDRRFANAILDARMLELFLSFGTAWAVEMSGSSALLYGRRSQPADRAQLIDAAQAFVDAIPRAVGSLYPPETERRPLPWSLPSPSG